jgi:hypothetical protein
MVGHAGRKPKRLGGKFQSPNISPGHRWGAGGAVAGHGRSRAKSAGAQIEILEQVSLDQLPLTYCAYWSVPRCPAPPQPNIDRPVVSHNLWQLIPDGDLQMVPFVDAFRTFCLTPGFETQPLLLEAQGFHLPPASNPTISGGCTA